MLNFTTILFLLLASIITASGQLLVKLGSQVLGRMPNSSQNIFQKITSIIFEPHIFFALILYFLSLFVWLKVLTKAELSQAYPMLVSLTILITSLSAIFLFKESLTGLKITGVLLIMIGLFLMSQGGK